MISSERKCMGKYYYVKWLGYDEKTWEPKSNLMQDVPDLIKEYEDKK